MRNKNSIGIFDSENLGKEPILILGAGGVGSVSAYYLAQMGCENLTVVDFDEVELHNTASQFYKDSDIGKLKVEALKENIKDFTGVDITIINKKIEAPEDIQRDQYKIILVAVDNMDTRKFIVDQIGDQHVIETRMGGELFSIFAFNPFFEKDLRLSYWYPQSEASPEICTEKSISYNTGMIGGLVAHKVKSLLKGEPVAFSTNFDFRTYELLNHVF